MTRRRPSRLAEAQDRTVGNGRATRNQKEGIKTLRIARGSRQRARVTPSKVLRDDPPDWIDGLLLRDAASYIADGASTARVHARVARCARGRHSPARIGASPEIKRKRTQRRLPKEVDEVALGFLALEAAASRASSAATPPVVG